MHQTPKNMNDHLALEAILGNFKTHWSKRGYSQSDRPHNNTNNQRKERNIAAKIKQTKTLPPKCHDYQI